MTRMYLYNGSRFSNGAKELAKNLGIKRAKHKNSNLTLRDKDIVINWGCSELPERLQGATVINHPSNVVECTNKLSFLEKVKDLNTPEYTSDYQTALSWARNGSVIVVRRLLRASSARGLEIFDPSVDPLESLPRAPLYTKYIKKRDEYRVHVAFNEVIDVQKKGRKTDVPDAEVNWKVRNLAGGFIYMREGVTLDQSGKNLCLEAHSLTGLDFGAYDIIWNENQNKFFILEVNTAPGLQGSTLENYTKIFKDKLCT